MVIGVFLLGTFLAGGQTDVNTFTIPIWLMILCSLVMSLGTSIGGLRIIKAVGNYGESFDRNVGAGSKLQIARGLNKLWNQGGIQYAPPIR